MKDYKIVNRIGIAVCCSFVLSLLLYQATGLNRMVCAWGYALAYFGLTMCCFKYLRKDTESTSSMLLAIVLGRIVLEVPLTILSFIGRLPHLAFLFTSLLAIMLGMICYVERKAWAYILSLLIMAILITFPLEQWHAFILERYFVGI